jgi:hypothetical protein
LNPESEPVDFLHHGAFPGDLKMFAATTPRLTIRLYPIFPVGPYSEIENVMRIGVLTALFSQLPLAAALEKIAAVHIDTVELGTPPCRIAAAWIAGR